MMCSYPGTAGSCTCAENIAADVNVVVVHVRQVSCYVFIQDAG